MRAYLLLVLLFVAGVVAVSSSALPDDSVSITATGATIEFQALHPGSYCETPDDAGTYEIKTAERTVADAGLHIVIQARHGDAWQRHRDIWTSDAPPPKV